jgi:hypothetical protein
LGAVAIDGMENNEIIDASTPIYGGSKGFIAHI